MAKTTTKKTPKTPAPAKPNRARTYQINARLSEEENTDLQAVVSHWEEEAKAKGYGGHGFADWLRSIITREKRAMSKSR